MSANEGLTQLIFRDKQHIGVVLGLGGLFPAKEVVQAVLAPQDGQTKAILDLGWCNSISK
jgi:hypothetical protein